MASVLGVARVTSQVHPNARKHPSGATTTGGLWASPFALHALAVLPHGSRLGRFRGVSAALRRFNTSRAMVARAYPSMRGAAGCDQVPSPGTAAALGQLGAGQSDLRSKAGSGISSTDLSTCNRVLRAQIHLHRVRARRYSDYNGHVEGMLIEVTSLYCVVAGFEVMLRTTAESQGSGSSDTLG